MSSKQMHSQEQTGKHAGSDDQRVQQQANQSAGNVQNQQKNQMSQDRFSTDRITTENQQQQDGANSAYNQQAPSVDSHQAYKQREEIIVLDKEMDDEEPAPIRQVTFGPSLSGDHEIVQGPSTITNQNQQDSVMNQNNQNQAVYEGHSSDYLREADKEFEARWHEQQNSYLMYENHHHRLRGEAADQYNNIATKHNNPLVISPPRGHDLPNIMEIDQFTGYGGVHIGEQAQMTIMDDQKENDHNIKPVQETQPNFSKVDGMQMELGENDKRFYSLAELTKMEPIFEKKFQAGGGSSQNNQHVLLSPQEYRAKFYWLDQENRWIDIGTGRFRILLSKDGIEHYIQIVSEDIPEDENRQGQQIDDEVNILDDSVVGDESQTDRIPSVGASDEPGTDKSMKQVILHRSFIGRLQEFSRQGETIITWQDDFKNEFALSFQDEKGAMNTWWSICFLKGMQINSNIDEQKTEGNDINETNTDGIIEDEISIPTKDNLAELVNELIVNDPFTRRTVADAVMKRDQDITKSRGDDQSDHFSDQDHKKLQTWRSVYLDKIQKIFNEVEEQYFKATKAQEQNEGDEHDRYIYISQQVSNLHSLFQIFRNLLSLNQGELLEVLLNENYYLTTFGALEYDPEVFNPTGRAFENEAGGRSPVQSSYSQNPIINNSPRSSVRSFGGSFDHLDPLCNVPREASYRDFLQNIVQFKEAVAIDDQSVIQNIHLSYKLQYLKDTAMARFIDEATSHAIMQLVAVIHQQILDYIFGDDFERIQDELLQKMSDNSNIKDKEAALKFFLEICSLLKSIQLTNRFVQTCNNAFNKLMNVLAHTFNIMIPDKKTLYSEFVCDQETLLQIYADREQSDIKNVKEQTEALDSQADQQMKGEPQEQEQSLIGPNMIVNPSKETIKEYLKKPTPSEDPRMTQIDVLKSNSIEIFYNLLILQNNVNNQNMRSFLCSEFQKANKYIFLRHLARHMIYSSQMGIKVSIGEFFKDLISKETSEMQKNFQYIILHEVVDQFLEFLTEDDFPEKQNDTEIGGEAEEPIKTDQQNKESNAQSQYNTQTNEQEKTERKEEQKMPATDALKNQFKRQMDHSRILILQFFNKLIQDNVDPYQIRTFFVGNKVMQKVANCQRFKSIQTNVEIIKFFKAIILAKDTQCIIYMIKKDLFDQIIQIFLQNENKSNLLHSCILNLFDMLTPTDCQGNSGSGILGQSSLMSNSGYGNTGLNQQILNKLYNRLVERNHAKTVFFDNKYERDFRKFNKYLKTSKLIRSESEQSEIRSKVGSDRNRSSSVQKGNDDNAEKELEEICFPSGNDVSQDDKKDQQGFYEPMQSGAEQDICSSESPDPTDRKQTDQEEEKQEFEAANLLDEYMGLNKQQEHVANEGKMSPQPVIVNVREMKISPGQNRHHSPRKPCLSMSPTLKTLEYSPGALGPIKVIVNDQALNSPNFQQKAGRLGGIQQSSQEPRNRSNSQEAQIDLGVFEQNSDEKRPQRTKTPKSNLDSMSNKSNPDMDEFSFNQQCNQNRGFPVGISLKAQTPPTSSPILPTIPRSSSYGKDMKKRQNKKYDRDKRRAQSEEQAVRIQGGLVKQRSGERRNNEEMLPPLGADQNEAHGDEEEVNLGKRSRAVFEQVGTKSPSRLFFTGEEKRQNKGENLGYEQQTTEAFNLGEPHPKDKVLKLTPNRKSIELLKLDSVTIEHEDSDGKDQALLQEQQKSSFADDGDLL